mgnify:CR=1 FL=1
MANIMKIINFGSLNIDKVCSVEEFVQPGETIMATGYSVNAGGKGLNQSVAAARAGAQVLHAGAVGSDGLFSERNPCRCWCGCFLSAGHGYRKRLCFY